MSLKEVKEFKINDYITLKLDNNKTFIYVKGERFKQCKYLLLNIKIDEITFLDEIDSVDEAAAKLDNNLNRVDYVEIPPEVEFWGHCSNLQVWVEYDYNTRLLHSNLAFPLLKELAIVGDPIAKKVFKEEIAYRLSSKYLPVIRYLIEGGYIEFLNEEELKIAYSEFDHVIINNESIPAIGEKLDLSYRNINSISEIKGLEDCTYLKKLKLSHNKIKKIEGLELLNKLQELQLGHNQIEKIEGLETLTSLEELFLGSNKIQKIERLGSLTNLRDLNLNNNQIKNIEGLNTLINLNALELNHNKVQKVEGLNTLTNLRELYLAHNQIRKIEGLDVLNNLRKLFLSYNQVHKIEGLDTLSNLRDLSLKGNPIAYIEGLNNLGKLETLFLDHCQIKRIHRLDSLINIQQLYLDYNQIQKIENLDNLKKLKYLNLRKNPIKVLEGLEKLEHLRNLDLDKTGIDPDLLIKLGINLSGFIKDPTVIIEYCKKKKNSL